MPAKKPARPATPPAYPLPVPDGATHFRLRRGGSGGDPVIWTDDKGVDQDNFPLSLFTKEAIVRRAGYHRHFSVQFSRYEGNTRKPLGAYRRLGLPDPRDQVVSVADPPPAPDPAVEVVSATAMVPSPSGPTFADSLQALRVLKEITGQEVNARVESDRNFMTKMLEIVNARGMMVAPAPSTDPAILQAMAAMTEGMKNVVTRLEALEEEEPEDETDDERIERVVKEWKRKGMSAFADYVGEESVEGLVRAFPKLKAKVPELFAQVGPMLKARIAEINAALDGPAPAAAAPVVNPAPAAAAPKKKAAPPPPAADEHTPTVK